MFFMKRVFPVIWFGFLAIFVSLAAVVPAVTGDFDAAALMFVIGPVLMAPIATTTFRDE